MDTEKFGVLKTDLLQGLTEKEISEGYQKFKADKTDQELTNTAEKYALEAKELKSFVEVIIDRMVFDGEKLSELMEPLGLGWKERSKKELELMEELIPLLNKLTGGREITGLSAYE